MKWILKKHNKELIELEKHHRNEKSEREKFAATIGAYNLLSNMHKEDKEILYTILFRIWEKSKKMSADEAIQQVLKAIYYSNNKDKVVNSIVEEADQFGYDTKLMKSGEVIQLIDRATGAEILW